MSAYRNRILDDSQKFVNMKIYNINNSQPDKTNREKIMLITKWVA